MILDANLLFDSASAITASATTQSSANIVDLLNARDMGIGDADQATPKMLILVTTAFATTNSATLTILLQGAPDNGSGSPGTYSTYAQSRAYSASDLTVQRKLLPVDWPHRGPGDALPRFLRVLYSVGTGVFSTGALTTAMILGRDDLPLYPSGFTVSN